MVFINKILRKFIIKLKNKYWWTKRIYYVKKMYIWYKFMLKHTKEDIYNKEKYVKWLLYFIKYYYALKKLKNSH